MKFVEKDPPREFEVGFETNRIKIKDCASIFLDPDEQVTFTTVDGKEYDVARKSWGFYATPSLNGRLTNFGLRPVLVKNLKHQFFVFLVERGKEPLLYEYLAADRLEIVCWLDQTETLQTLAALTAETLRGDS